MVLRILKYKWSVLLTSGRFYAALIFIIFFLDIYIAPIRIFCRTVGEKISPFLYPCLITDNSLLLLLLLSFLFLIADVPFMDHSVKYIMIRSGKKAWLKGQMNYLLAVSIFFMVFIYAGSILLCLPYLQIMGGWGRIIGTLAQTNAGVSFSINIFPSYAMMLDYTPVEAVLITMAAGILVVYLFCLVLFWISLYFSRMVGMCIVTGEILIVTTAWRLGKWGIYVFPVTWMQLTTVTKNKVEDRPYIWFTWAVLLILIFFIRFMILMMSRHLEVVEAAEQE